jgi:hypothetical protein
MRINLNATPDQIELIKAVGSRNRVVSAEAMEVLAGFLGGVVAEVLKQAGTASLFYVDETYDEEDNPSYPLDLYWDKDVGTIPVWSQHQAGGLPTCTVEGSGEMKIATYRLDSAVSFNKKYARKSRLNIVSKALERMAQEVLVKQELNAWAVILKALAEANTNGNRHVIRANTAGTFLPADLSDLITRIKRINTSFAGGTPANMTAEGLTDLVVSPEVKGDIRAFGYNPVNTTAGPTSAVGTEVGSTVGIPLPDAMRMEIFRAAGAQELWGVSIVDILELGVAQKYNTLFDEFAGSTTYGGTAFDGATEELLVGADLSRGALIRALIQGGEGAGAFTVFADDQFVARQDKAGFYGFLEEGRAIIDARALCGIIV